MNRVGMLHCSLKYHIMVKYHTIALCDEIIPPDCVVKYHTTVFWRNIIPQSHCAAKYHAGALWWNTIALFWNILRSSLAIVSARFSHYICDIYLLSRCAEDHASPQSNFIDCSAITLLLRWNPLMELKGFTVPHEPPRPASLLLHGVVNQTRGFEFRFVFSSWWRHRDIVHILSVDAEYPIFWQDKPILECMLSMLTFIRVIVGGTPRHI
jgi:hypothetical protein